MMSFGNIHSHDFSILGFIGFIIIALYLFIIIYCRKRSIYNFTFSIIVLSIYLILLCWLTLLFKTNITFENSNWFRTFFICLTIDGIIYLIKINTRKKNK